MDELPPWVCLPPTTRRIPKPKCSTRFENNCFAVMKSSSEEGSFLRLVVFCITQLWAEGSKEEEGRAPALGLPPTHQDSSLSLLLVSTLIDNCYLALQNSSLLVLLVSTLIHYCSSALQYKMHHY